MIKMISSQILKSLKCFSVLRNQHESLITFDFYKSQRHQALMRLCFSSFSAWPVFLILAAFYLNPLRYHFSLAVNLGLDHKIVQMLYGADQIYALVFVLALFVLTFLIRHELIWISAIGFLVSQGDIHLVLALISIAVIFSGRALSHICWIRHLKSYTKIIWTMFSFLSFVAWATAVYVSFEFYQFLAVKGYFSQSMYANRFECFIWCVFFYYGLELLILSIWGHFAARKIFDPSEFIVHYSSAKILKKLLLSKAFKSDLIRHIQQIKSEQVPRVKADLDLLPKRLVDLYHIEESFLNKAISDLT